MHTSMYVYMLYIYTHYRVHVSSQKKFSSIPKIRYDPHGPSPRSRRESLSFALTNNITVVGYNFGLLKREARAASFCAVWMG